MFQFLSLNSGDEREQLIPVLTTMLRLSPEEKQKLSNIASGQNVGAEAGGAADASGWGTYLHRWSGLV